MLKNVFITLFCIICLCGCSLKSEKEVVSFSSWGSVTEVEILKNVISDFEKENPNIKIDFIHIPQNYFQKIHLLFASQTAPDVLFMNNLNLPIYESKLEKLSDIVEEDDFYQQALQGMSYDDKLLGVPRDISNLVLYINLDRIMLPMSEWTIKDFLNIAKNNTDEKHFGIGCEQDIYWVTPYLSYFGGGILDKDLKNIFNSQESLEALNLYKDLIYKYKYAPQKSQVGSLTLAQMFLDEKIAMYLSGRWMYPKILEKANFKWAVVNFPYGKEPQLCDVSGWVISKDSKHKESAKKFIKYLSSQKTSQYFANAGLIVPARKSISKSLDNKEHNEKVFLEVIEHSKNTPVNKNYKKLIDKINNEKF